MNESRLYIVGLYTGFKNYLKVDAFFTEIGFRACYTRS